MGGGEGGREHFLQRALPEEQATLEARRQSPLETSDSVFKKGPEPLAPGQRFNPDPHLFHFQYISLHLSRSAMPSRRNHITIMDLGSVFFYFLSQREPTKVLEKMVRPLHKCSPFCKLRHQGKMNKSMQLIPGLLPLA